MENRTRYALAGADIGKTSGLGQGRSERVGKVAPMQE